MSYIKENLLPNEKILFSARVHPAIFLQSIFLCGLVACFLSYSLGFSAIFNSSDSSGPSSGFSGFPGLILLCLYGFFFLYAIGLGLQALIFMLTTEFAVTNRRVIAKAGFIRRHTLELLLSKVESVAVHQNVLGRLLNYGTVIVTGTGGTRESFRAIINPMDVRRKINQIIEQYSQSILR